jgi:hypothetical protein
MTHIVPVIEINASQTHRREITLHCDRRSRTVALTGRGDAAAQTRALAELTTAGLVQSPADYTGRHPGDWS